MTNYIFGTTTYNGQPIENLKIVGDSHTDIEALPIKTPKGGGGA